MIRFFILIFTWLFLFTGCQSDLRAKYIVKKNYSPRNTYRELRTGEFMMLMQDESSYDMNHDYFVLGSGRPLDYDIVDHSGYVVYLAGINSFMISGHPYLAGCTGCDSCYKIYQQAGLVKYEVLHEEYPFCKVRVTLTKKGEEYALDRRIDSDSPGYDKVMEAKQRGIQYLLFNYNRISLKESEGFCYVNGPTRIRASDFWVFTKYTPFATALGLTEPESPYGYDAGYFIRYKFGRWRQQDEISREEQNSY